MNDQYTEEEDKLVSWFKDNYKNMVIGIISGGLFVLGYSYIGDKSLNEQYEMSLMYENAVISYQEEKYDAVLSLSDELSSSNPSNIYTALINLYSAKIHHDNENYDKALNVLKIIIENSNSPEILDIAKLRSARIFIFLQKDDDAKNLILSIDDYRNKAIPTEILGDIEYYNLSLIHI